MTTCPQSTSFFQLQSDLGLLPRLDRSGNHVSSDQRYLCLVARRDLQACVNAQSFPMPLATMSPNGILSSIKFSDAWEDFLLKGTKWERLVLQEAAHKGILYALYYGHKFAPCEQLGHLSLMIRFWPSGCQRPSNCLAGPQAASTSHEYELLANRLSVIAIGTVSRLWWHETTVSLFAASTTQWNFKFTKCKIVHSRRFLKTCADCNQQNGDILLSKVDNLNLKNPVRYPTCPPPKIRFCCQSNYCRALIY